MVAGELRGRAQVDDDRVRPPQQLLGVDDTRLSELVASNAVGDPLARAGISEVLSPRGLAGMPGQSRAEAVAVAVAVKTVNAETSHTLR